MKIGRKTKPNKIFTGIMLKSEQNARPGPQQKDANFIKIFEIADFGRS